MAYPVQAMYPGHVWSWDFIMDRTTDGRPVKMLTMVDEYTRQCLVIHPAQSITSNQVLDTLNNGSPCVIDWEEMDVSDFRFDLAWTSHSPENA